MSPPHSTSLWHIMVSVISFSCHNILKRRDNRQLEIRVSEPRIRRQLTLFISHPLSSVSNPRFFPAARIIDQPPLCVGKQASGGAAQGEDISLVLNQTTSSILPVSHPSPFFLSLSLLPQSLGCNRLTRVHYLMTCESN